MKLEAIERLEQLTEKDIEWLTKGCAAVKLRRLEVPHLLARLGSNLILLRVVGDKCEGIVALTPNAWEGELWLDLYAGKNVMTVELRNLLMALVKRLGFRKLTGYVERKGIGRWYSRNVSAKPVAVLYVEEID